MDSHPHPGEMRSPYRLRCVEKSDAPQILQWANHLHVRQCMFSSNSITEEEHGEWWKRITSDPATLFLMMEDVTGDPVGHIRFEKHAETVAIVSVTVSPSMQGLGIGKVLVREGTIRLFTEHPEYVEVHAYIKTMNTASIRAFSASGYEYKCSAQYKGHPCRLYIARPVGLFCRQ